MASYVFDQQWQNERARLAQLESFFQSSSTRFLTEAGGARPGLRCLDAGAGGGAIAAWLGERVGPGGHVVAADIDPRFLPNLTADNVEVWKHDIVAEALPEAEFDLVHARCLLEHLPARTAVLKKLIAAVRPGGRIVVSDCDFGAATTAATAQHLRPADYADLYQKVYAAVATVFRGIGADPAYGPKLMGALLDAGLAEVGAEITAPVVSAGGKQNWMRLTLDALHEPLMKMGLLTPEELTAAVTMSEDPDCRYVPLTMVTAWGTKI
jgi:SAM-dependent methyltransferase